MNFDRSFTYYLFARSSFLEGAARVADVGGVFDSYNESPTPAIADSRAMLHDWLMVGADLQSAFNAYEQEVKA